MSGKRKHSGRVSVSYRLDPVAVKALGKIRQTWGLSKTKAVERALIFASAHPAFLPASVEVAA